jgi:glycosyltransferase involved in cell wall biosynthesis
MAGEPEGPKAHAQAHAEVAVLSFSRIVRDRRVLRQCKMLADMGHPPLVIAYANEDEAIPHRLLRWPAPKPTTAHRLRTLARQLPSHLGLAAAKAGFWVEPRHRWALAELMRAKPRLIIAHDWPALVVAAACKARTGTSIHYDVHEFATLEFDESPWWRMVYKPMVTHLERANIHAADTVSTVGPGLAEALQRLYGLSARPLVLRSTPERSLEGRAPVAHEAGCPWPMRILFHGHLLPGRGLEALLASMPAWKTPHTLLIRGDAAPGYAARLKKLAAEGPHGARVTFEPAVPPDDVVPAAARSADLGVFFTPLGTGQQHFNLPNKLFEYVAAGLAVAVSPGVDLKATVEEFGIGVVSADSGPEAIAATINGLTRERVVAFKAASRAAAAGELCWEAEKEKLAAALAAHLDGARAAK